MASVDFFIIFLCSIVYIFFLLNDIINYNKSSIKYTTRNDSLKTIKNLFGLSGIVLSVFEFKIAIEQSYCNGIFGIFVFLNIYLGKKNFVEYLTTTKKKT